MTRPAPLRLGFSGNRLRRDGEGRTDGSLAQALAHPQARVYLSIGGQWLCRGDAERSDPAFGRSEAEAMLGGEPITLLLGHDADGVPHLAAALTPGTGEAEGADASPPAGAPAEAHLRNLRTLGMRESLDPDTEGQLAQAAHLLGWHAGTRFCGRCGAPTVSEAAGFRRRCTACGHLVFPRTDPVSIMLVHDGAGRCVLGRQPHFAPGMWSCLAGFVEAGETLEQAVARETMEEAGLHVRDVRYHASQPWPFPGSLMIGCIALADPGDIVFDAGELEDCRWFEHDEVSAMLAAAHPDGLTVPPGYAIAHHLIRHFVLEREAARPNDEHSMKREARRT